jgi:hypothetical protein
LPSILFLTCKFIFIAIAYEKIVNEEIKVTYLPINTTVRITLFNIVGPSNISNEKVITCLYCDIGIDYNTTFKPEDNSVTSQPTEPPFVLIASIVGSVVVALIIIILVVIFIKK